MFKVVLSLLLALASSIDALIIVNPQQGSSYSNGATLGVVVIMDSLETGISNAQVIFQSATGSQTVNVPIGPVPTLVTLNSAISDLTLIAAIPIMGNIGQVAQPGYSNIIVGRAVPIPDRFRSILATILAIILATILATILAVVNQDPSATFPVKAARSPVVVSATFPVPDVAFVTMKATNQVILNSFYPVSTFILLNILKKLSNLNKNTRRT